MERRCCHPQRVSELLTGFLLFNTMETAVVGALFVAGVVYALIVPRLVRPSPTSANR